MYLYNIPKNLQTPTSETLGHLLMLSDVKSGIMLPKSVKVLKNIKLEIFIYLHYRPVLNS